MPSTMRMLSRVKGGMTVSTTSETTYMPPQMLAAVMPYKLPRHNCLLLMDNREVESDSGWPYYLNSTIGGRWRAAYVVKLYVCLASNTPSSEQSPECTHQCRLCGGQDWR